MGAWREVVRHHQVIFQPPAMPPPPVPSVGGAMKGGETIKGGEGTVLPLEGALKFGEIVKDCEIPQPTCRHSYQDGKPK